MKTSWTVGLVLFCSQVQCRSDVDLVAPDTIDILLTVTGLLLVLGEVVIWRREPKKIPIQFMSELSIDKGDQGTTMELPHVHSSQVEVTTGTEPGPESSGAEPDPSLHDDSRDKKRRRRKADKLSDRRKKDEPSFEEEEA